MKITKKHCDSLLIWIKPVIMDITKDKTVLDYYTNNKLSETRFLWDIFWAIPNKAMRDKLQLEIYEYIKNSDVITTALKKVVKKLFKEYELTYIY